MFDTWLENAAFPKRDRTVPANASGSGLGVASSRASANSASNAMVPSSLSDSASTVAAKPSTGVRQAHGFQEDDAKTFAAGGHNKEISHPIGIDEDSLIEHADEAHLLRQSSSVSKVLQRYDHRPHPPRCKRRHDLQHEAATALQSRGNRRW